jgi:hypothetical protein
MPTEAAELEKVSLLMTSQAGSPDTRVAGDPAPFSRPTCQLGGPSVSFSSHRARSGPVGPETVADADGEAAAVVSPELGSGVEDLLALLPQAANVSPVVMEIVSTVILRIAGPPKSMSRTRGQFSD